MLHLRFLRREMVGARRQATIFVLCVALSISSLVALNSFRRDIDRSIIGDAQALHGGDILIHSHYEISPPLLAALPALEKRGVQALRSWEFYSVLRSLDEKNNLFCQVKVVAPGYPLYGEVSLQSGANFAEQLQPGTIIVGRSLLDRLGLALGDSVLVGGARLRIVDVVVHESARPLEVFSLGPRVFVAAADLAELGLVKSGSRVEHEIALKLADPGETTKIVAELDKLVIGGQERVESSRSARSGLKRFFDNLLFFLSLISIFTLLLAGIGMQSSLAALLREKERSLAIAKALGASHGFLLRHYLALVLLFGLIGSILGSTLGAVLKFLFPLLFAGILPEGSIGPISFADVAGGMLLGLVVVCFFTFLPLYRLRDVKPNVIFRHDIGHKGKGKVYYLAVVIGLGLMSLLVIQQLADVKIGLLFMLACLGLILITSILTHGLFAGLKRLSIKALVPRQALRSLLRQGYAGRSIVVTLASALALLLAIFLVQANLQASYVESYPAAAPNVFVLDIQKDQQEGFRSLAGPAAEMYPIIRARLQAINATPVNRDREQQKRGDSLAREFNLTYRDSLLDDEILVEGDELFRRDSKGQVPLQVSILDTVAEMGDMELGDILSFTIQGVPLTAEVTSIRSRIKSKLYPFFYFVFPAEFLQAAPQTYFAALHLERQEIAAFENRVVRQWPNVSLINAAETATQLGVVMAKLSGIVNFFAGFSIVAGGLIMVSSILATRLARMEEAVYYRVLGAKAAFIRRVFIAENVLLGLVSAGLAVVIAQVGSWLMCRRLFDITYEPAWLVSLLLVLATIAAVTAIGMASSFTIIREKPARFLREQTPE